MPTLVTDNPPVMHMRGIRTSFGDTVIHDDINLDVQAGEILAIVGGSGAGKTVLLRTMIGLHKPTRGLIEVFGADLHGLDAHALQALRRRWGVLFQNGALFSALNVFDNIALPLREMRLLSEAEIEALVRGILAAVDLPARTARLMPAELSGGMVKRVALARALVVGPELLLLDEPTSGLDPVASDHFATLLEDLRIDLGLTVIMATHDLNLLADLCDRVAVLAERRLVAIGPPREVRRADHPFVASFLRGPRGTRAFTQSAPAGS